MHTYIHTHIHTQEEDGHKVVCDYPPNRIRDVVTVTVNDLRTLAPDEYVNDTIMDFYIKFLQVGFGRFRVKVCMYE